MCLFRWSGLLSLALLVASCGGPPAAAPGTRMVSTEAVRTLLADALDGTPLTRGALTDRLGPPLRTRAAGPDSLETLVYHGLELMLHGTAPGGLARMALTDARYTSPEGLRVGYAHDYVRTTLGRPTEQAPARLLYAKPGPPPCTLVVYLEADKVSRLEWLFDPP